MRGASLTLLLFMTFTSTPSPAEPIRVIAIGAHPDDCDIKAGGIAAKYAALGHKVRFVSVTNGDAGHQAEGGGMLAARRRAGGSESGRRLGIEYIVLDNHDGELVPSLDVRLQIIARSANGTPTSSSRRVPTTITRTTATRESWSRTLPTWSPFQTSPATPPAIKKNPLFLVLPRTAFRGRNRSAPTSSWPIDEVLEKKYLSPGRSRVSVLRVATVACGRAGRGARRPGRSPSVAKIPAGLCDSRRVARGS